MALIQCEVTEGPRAGFKAIGIESIEGHTEYLAIEEKFLVRNGDGFLLSVSLVGRDRRNKTVLVQLPVEADSGANRVWVSEQALSPAADEVPV
jgi:hypothetical protein